MERIKSKVSAYEVRKGDVIHFQPGGKPFTVKEAEYLFVNDSIPQAGANFRIETDCGMVFATCSSYGVFIARKPECMVRFKRDSLFGVAKAGDVLPAYAYLPSVGDLLLVQATEIGDELSRVMGVNVSAGDVEVLP